MFYNISSVYFFHQHHHSIVCVCSIFLSSLVLSWLRCCHIQYYIFVSHALFALRRVRDKLQWGFIPSTFFVALSMVVPFCYTAVQLILKTVFSRISLVVMCVVASSFFCRLGSITIPLEKFLQLKETDLWLWLWLYRVVFIVPSQLHNFGIH